MQTLGSPTPQKHTLNREFSSEVLHLMHGTRVEYASSVFLMLVSLGMCFRFGLIYGI